MRAENDAAPEKAQHHEQDTKIRVFRRHYGQTCPQRWSARLHRYPARSRYAPALRAGAKHFGQVAVAGWAAVAGRSERIRHRGTEDQASPKRFHRREAAMVDKFHRRPSAMVDRPAERAQRRRDCLKSGFAKFESSATLISMHRYFKVGRACSPSAPYSITNGGFGPPAIRRLPDSTAGRRNRPMWG